MNAKTKEVINRIAIVCSNVINGFSGTISSIFRILLFSKISIAFKSRLYRDLKMHDNCTILANGPSLKSAIENNEVRLKDVDIFCVNSFCESEYFWQIRPRFYFLIDGAFFNPKNERNERQVASLIEALNKVNWDLLLCIPTHAICGGVLKGLKNERIKILRFNTTTTEGYSWFANLIYRYSMGMPWCMNVVNFAEMSAMQMKFKNIYLYGIDHTFPAQLFVDDDNCVCSREHHVYATEGRVFKLPHTSMSRILRNQSRAFSIHEQLEDYSKSVGCKIYNCTKGSFVDAYARIT